MTQIDEVTPILNVSNIEQSVLWFRKLGWDLLFLYGDPPNFASVGSPNAKIFLALDSQGGRGQHAMWVAVWVPNVDEVYEALVNTDVEILKPPTDEPWNVREMHLKHLDGHILRISRVIVNE